MSAHSCGTFGLIDSRMSHTCRLDFIKFEFYCFAIYVLHCCTAAGRIQKNFFPIEKTKTVGTENPFVRVYSTRNRVHKRESILNSELNVSLAAIDPGIGGLIQVISICLMGRRCEFKTHFHVSNADDSLDIVSFNKIIFIRFHVCVCVCQCHVRHTN